MTEADALNEPGELYRHKKGGIYRLRRVTSLRDSKLPWKGDQPYRKSQQLVTYEHLWPHMPSMFQRPYAEFMQPDRFAKIVRLQG